MLFYGNATRGRGARRLGLEELLDDLGKVADLSADANHWFAGEAPMAPDKAACRLDHKLVEIHPFPNGNGRHARELTDLVLLTQGAQPFTWGRDNLVNSSQTRRTYVDALVMADIGRYEDLEAFVRS